MRMKNCTKNSLPKRSRAAEDRKQGGIKRLLQSGEAFLPMFFGRSLGRAAKSLFDRKDIVEARDLEYLHYRLVYVDDLHTAEP